MPTKKNNFDFISIILFVGIFVLTYIYLSEKTSRPNKEIDSNSTALILPKEAKEFYDLDEVYVLVSGANVLNVVFLNETNAKAFIASRNLEILSTHCVPLEDYIKVLNVQLQKEREKNDEDL